MFNTPQQKKMMKGSKKLISVFLALIFLANCICPAWAREGNFGKKDSKELFNLSLLAGAVSYIPNPLFAIGSVVFDAVDMYMFFNYYNSYNEKMISFKIGGEEVVIGKGQLYAMISSVVVSALVGFIAGGLEGGAEAAAKEGAEAAGEAAPQAAAQSTASSIIQAIVDGIKEAFDYAIKSLKSSNIFIQVITFIPRVVLEVIKEVLCGFVRTVGKTIERLVNFAGDMYTHPLETLKNLFKDTFKNIKDAIISDAKSMAEVFAKNQHFIFGQALNAAIKEGSIGLIAKTILYEISYLALVDIPAAVLKMCAKEAAKTVAEKKWGWDETPAAIFGSVAGTYVYTFSYGFFAKISAALTPFVDWAIGPDGSLVVNQKVNDEGKLVDNQKAVDDADANHSNDPTTDFFADIFVNSFAAGLRGAGTLGVAPLTDALAKIAVLKAMHYQTYRGSNTDKIWDNAIKMAIAESISNIAEGTVNSLPSIYNGYGKYKADQEKLANPKPATFDDYMAEKTGSLIANKFLSQLGSLAGEIAWAKYCQKNDISPGSSYELLHLAASSIIGSAIAGGNPIENFGINLWRSAANSAPLFIPTQWYNLRIPTGAKPDEKGSGAGTGGGKTEGETLVKGGEFNYTNPILLQGRYSERLYAYVDSNARQSGWGSVSNPILVTANTITQSLNSAANTNLANAVFKASREPVTTLRYGKGQNDYVVVKVSELKEIEKNLADKNKELKEQLERTLQQKKWLDEVTNKKIPPYLKILPIYKILADIMDKVIEPMRKNADREIRKINADISQKQNFVDQITVRNINLALSAYKDEVSKGVSGADSGPRSELQKTKDDFTKEIEKLKKEAEELINKLAKERNVAPDVIRNRLRKSPPEKLSTEERELLATNNRIARNKSFVKTIDLNLLEIEKGAGKPAKETGGTRVVPQDLKIGKVSPVNTKTVEGTIKIMTDNPVRPDKMTSDEGALVTVEKAKPGLAKYFAPAGLIRDEVTFFVPKEIFDKYNKQLETSALEAYHVDTGKQKIEADANKMLMDYLQKTYPDTFKEYFPGGTASAPAKASEKPGFTLASATTKAPDTFSFDWFRSNPEALKVAKIAPVADKGLYDVTLTWKKESGEEEKITCKVPRAEVERAQQLFERCGEINAYHYYLKEYIIREKMANSDKEAPKKPLAPTPGVELREEFKVLPAPGVELEKKFTEVTAPTLPKTADIFDGKRYRTVTEDDFTFTPVFTGNYGGEKFERASTDKLKEIRDRIAAQPSKFGDSPRYMVETGRDFIVQDNEGRRVIVSEDQFSEYIRMKSESPEKGGQYLRDKINAGSSAPAPEASKSMTPPLEIPVGDGKVMGPPAPAGVDMNIKVNSGSFTNDTTGELNKLREKILKARRDNPKALAVQVE